MSVVEKRYYNPNMVGWVAWWVVKGVGGILFGGDLRRVCRCDNVDKWFDKSMRWKVGDGHSTFFGKINDAGIKI